MLVTINQIFTSLGATVIVPVVIFFSGHNFKS